jgi:hypothetical protein
MTGDCHVRFPEDVGVKFLRVTRLISGHFSVVIFLDRLSPFLYVQLIPKRVLINLGFFGSLG